MEDFIKQIFNLENLIIYSTRATENSIEIKVGKLTRGDYCPHCKTYTEKIHAKGVYRSYKHTTIGNRPVHISIKRRRFMCINNLCGKSFTESVNSLRIKPWGRKTNNYNTLILTALQDQSFKSVSNKLNVSYSVARKVLESLVDPVELLWEKYKTCNTELRLGIDEHHFKNRKMLTTISDLISKKPIAILKNSGKVSLAKFINDMPQNVREQVTEVCIDMCERYRNCIKKNLPKASIVIDHFHVIKYANDAINKERKFLQEMNKERNFRNYKIKRFPLLANREDLDTKQEKILESILSKYPSLKMFHYIKEKLRDMYNLYNKKEALLALEFIIDTLRENDDAELVKFGNTLKNFKREILNFFDNRTTNAYVEGINNKFKVIQRISFGFRNVDVYTRKAVLSFIPLSIISQLHSLTH
jgi:transposase